MPVTYWGRIDSNSANNPALNLTGDAALQFTFVPSGGSGDILLEYNGGDVDPDTQVEIDGTNYDFVFEMSAFLPTQNSNGAIQVPDQFKGSVVYIITVQDYPTAGETTRLMFMPDEDATAADLNAFGNGAINLQSIDTTTPGVVCFAAGTMLATPDGECAVESLQVGDLVLTVDGEQLPIIWISSSVHAWPGSDEGALPMLIPAHALGDRKPSRDLLVSPQHKVLISNASAQLQAGAADVLVPAKGLSALPRIRQMKGKKRITYYHVLLERHAVVLSEGLASESFFPGPTAMRMLQPDQRSEIHQLIPGLKEDGAQAYGPTARPCLTYLETKALAKSMRSEMLAQAGDA